MVCLMPPLKLPDDLRSQLEMSESGMIDDTNGPGVAVYHAVDGLVRADIYLGLILDGYKLYRNISSLDHNIKMQFALDPAILCHADVLTFKPDTDDIIVIQVISMVVALRRHFVGMESTVIT